MKCEKVKELFSAYIENELSAREHEAFEQHLHECAHCREDLSKFKASLMLVENLREIDLPVTFHARTMSLLEREKYARPKKAGWFRLDWQHVFTVKVPAKAIASAFAALLLFAFIMHITPAGSFISGHLFPSAKTTTESLSGKDPDWAPPAPMPYIDESIHANNTVMVKPIGIDSDTASYTLYIKADKNQSKYIDIYKSTSSGFTWLYKLNANSARDVEVSRNTIYKVVQHSEKRKA